MNSEQKDQRSNAETGRSGWDIPPIPFIVVPPGEQPPPEWLAAHPNPIMIPGGFVPRSGDDPSQPPFDLGLALQKILERAQQTASGSVGTSTSPASSPGISTEAQLQAARTAYAFDPNDCNVAVWKYLQTTGQTINGTDPKGPAPLANDMLDRLAAAGSGWHVVSLEEGTKLANHGKVVIGGEKEPDHGHVVAMLPGPLHNAGGFKNQRGEMMRQRPELYPPALSASKADYPGTRSDGDKTVRDPFTPENWKDVHWYTQD